MSRDQTHISLFPVEDMTEEAIAFLREHEPEEGYFVGFSGGKDSIVTKILCEMAGVQHSVYYSATGIDPPEVVRFIKQEHNDVTILRPKTTFFKAIKKKAPPLRKARWCCDVLKKEPSKCIPLKHRVMGLRAEESKARSERPRIDAYKKQIMYKPIFYWKEWHIWEFIEMHNLSYPVLYDEGFDRIGCVICPFICHKNQAKLLQHKQRWPAMYAAFERTVKEWWEERRARKDGEEIKEKFKENTAEEYLYKYYRGFEE